MKVAMVTPLPPQHTGIADYVSDLIIGLKNNGFKIDLFSNAGINSYEDMNVYQIEAIDSSVLNDYDLIIYQMGNNIDFHLYMVELIKKYRGIIHLHDMVLHSVFGWVNFNGKGNKSHYYNTIKKWYGPNIEKLTEEMLEANILPWDSKLVIDIPLFEEFIQYADACIVHSDFVKEKIELVFPDLDVYRIDQLYNMDIVASKKINSEIVKFAIFGGVEPQKKVDVILKVFTEIKKMNHDANFLLTIVGGINDQAKYELDLLIKDQLEGHVKITGRVNEKEFMEYFLDTDILIALRYPTMGETSAVVMRAMQLGIPCIVNDIGWYSELPEHIMKIPVDNMEAELESTILEILHDDKRLKWLKKETLKYSKEELDFDKSIEEYSNIIKTIYNNQLDKLIYRQVGLVMDDLKYMDDPKIYTPVINKIIDIIQ